MTRPTSAAAISDPRGGFTLVETAVALAAAALFCGAVAVAVSGLLRADERRLQWREAGLWHETLFARRAIGRDPMEDPPPAIGWSVIADTVTLDEHGERRRFDRYRFAPESRPSFAQTLCFPEREERR